MRAVVRIFECCVVAFRIVVEGDVAWVTGTTHYRSVEVERKRFIPYLLNATCVGSVMATLQPPRLQSTSRAGIGERSSRYRSVLATSSMPRGIPM